MFGFRIEFGLDLRTRQMFEDVFSPPKPLTQPVSHRVKITDRETGLSIEGEHLAMNLKTTQEVDLEAKIKNRQGGPADPASVTGSWSGVFPNPDVCAVTSDPANPLKALAKGNGQATVTDADVGLAKFTGTRKASDNTDQPVDVQIAINLIMPGAETVEATAGEVREQA